MCFHSIVAKMFVDEGTSSDHK
uniref:Uncharacterized protein n=1 Tax=Lepeophtheirus salmonis TaxID=72036 RepID=A0A0K2UED4_LEPSM